jgi:hypothetical protein
MLAALDTGDEVTNAEHALEKGLDLQSPGRSAKAAAELAKKRSYADAHWRPWTCCDFELF